MAATTVDAVRVALLGRRRWIEHQGRANAALVLLAGDMEAQFLPPASKQDFAAVQGRAKGCTFEVRVSGSRRERQSVLEVTVRHYSAQTTVRLDGPGCTVPDLDPALLREAIEDVCQSFATRQ